jgi:hypothetical protein
MRTADRVALAALALLSLAVARPATATPAADRLRSLAAALGAGASTVRDSTRPAPAAVPTPPGGSPSVDLRDLSRPFALEARLRPFARRDPETLELAVEGGQARIGDFSIGSDQTITGHLLVLHGTADVYGTLRGNLVTYGGDVVLHRGARVEGSVVAVKGTVRNDGATVSGSARSLSAGALARSASGTDAAASPLEATAIRTAGVLGVFMALLLLGWGTAFFARSNLEIVSDTVRFSFPRALAVGLLGQVLAAPTFGMLVVGLILSVAGILLLPFAVIAFALLLVVTVLGGGLGAAHAMGETVVRRRLALGALGTPTGYRAIGTGLALPFTLWLVWALTAWVPVAGTIVFATAALATWFVWTAGFGAALLSRGGARENFAGRFIPPEALTDEFLWATPQFGVPAVKRPTAGEKSEKKDEPKTTRTGGGTATE